MIDFTNLPIKNKTYAGANGSKIAVEYEGCNAALKRIAPRIDLLKINTVIDEIPYIDELQKTFYKTMLKERKKKIIDFSLNKLLVRERI